MESLVEVRLCKDCGRELLRFASAESIALTSRRLDYLGNAENPLANLGTRTLANNLLMSSVLFSVIHF